MEVWCEEVSSETGEVASYKVCENPTPSQLNYFGIRARFNVGLQYWCTNLDGKLDSEAIKKLFKLQRKPPYFVKL